MVTMAARSPILPVMQVTRTKHGLRLSQHGVVISELRTSPGPTHSVFDVLAAMIMILRPSGRVGVLGFAGGGMLAPLHGLGLRTELVTVDLDQSSYGLFCENCPEWVAGVRWQRADAVEWLHRQTRKFDLLMDDLSVPWAGDVVKPDISWATVPELIQRRLKPGGVAVLNLMSPPGGRWGPGLARVTRRFQTARIIQLDDFENRILVAGQNLPAARVLGKRLGQALRKLHSRQAGRVHVRTVPRG
jgi:hypothetical protein